MRCRDGGMLRRPSSRSGVRRSRPRCSADVARICATLCQGAEERRSRRRGIAEAATRPTMRFIELKSQDQLDMQTLHRSRDRLVGERTALINQLRAILLERGLVAPQGKRKLEQFLSVLMDEQDGAGLSPRMIQLVDARTQWAESLIDGSLLSTPSSSAE